MKIIFFGSSEFAIPSLEALKKNDFEICSVVTQPDRKKGRFLHVASPAVKKVAAKLSLKVLQPEKLSDDNFLKQLNSLDADLFVVISYGKILTKQVLSIPKIFAVNVHGSLLPKYRGAAPVNWAVINAEKETGVTVMKMNERMDEGDIITKKQISVGLDETSETLNEKLSKLGAKALIETLKNIRNNNFSLLPQDHSSATYASKLKKEDGLIDWNMSADEILARIRGLVPWPGAFTHYRKKLLKVWKAEVAAIGSKDKKIGEIIEVSKNNFMVATSKDALKILEVQLESSKRMKAADFISGHRLSLGDILK